MYEQQNIYDRNRDYGSFLRFVRQWECMTISSRFTDRQETWRGHRQRNRARILWRVCSAVKESFCGWRKNYRSGLFQSSWP